VRPTDRRAVLKCASAWMVGKALTASAVTVGSAPVGFLPDQDSKDGPTVEQWMNAWMNRPLDSQSPTVRDEEGALFLGRFVEPMYFLTKSIKWKPNADQTGFSPVSVPVGFVTDLASIPRVFWSLLRPDGEYTFPAIVHDYLYWVQNTKRGAADMTLKMGMQDFGIGTSTINTIYEAVRVGGGSSWNNNAALREAGERRVLKRFPVDPRTRWKDWKKMPGVFGDV
jgi:hypothetical protein